MNTHLTILLWLGIIFVIAATIILFKLIKAKSGTKKESYLSFTIVFYLFGIALLIYVLIFGII